MKPKKITTTDIINIKLGLMPDKLPEDAETKNISIPFVGFYESTASQKAEDIAFHNFISEKDIKENKHGRMDIPDDLDTKQQEEFWDVYYPKHIKEIRQGIIDDYIEYFNDALNITAKFESISSPREYNFTTDRLFVDVPMAELMELYNHTDKNILAGMIKKRHTSGPGFDSFYANDINDPEWSDPARYDHNQWETIILAKVEQDQINLDELYYI